MTQRKSPVDQLLDLFVYAPLGFVMNLDEVVPQLIEKGHQQVNLARMFGQFAVRTGTQQVRQRVEQIAQRANGSAPQGDAGEGDAGEGVGGASTAPAPEPAAATMAEEPADGPPVEAPPFADELAITDYDSLAASQVVPRLDGLSADEREAVRRYEAAHRGRKTILSKLAQLG